VLALSDLTDLTDQITLPQIAGAGIPVALVGAVFLALGAQFQHKGVERMEQLRGQQTAGLSVRSRPSCSSSRASRCRRSSWCSRSARSHS
jgi:hypothetical protein